MKRRILTTLFAAALIAASVGSFSPLHAQTTDRLYGVQTGLAIKAPVQAVSSAALTLSGEQTVNGVAVTAGDRVLVKDQADATANGIYTVSTSAWLRAADFDGNRDVVDGTLVTVNRTSGANIFYQVSATNPVVIGTTDIAFIEINDPNISYDITASEISAGLTTDDITGSYPPGNVFRYGAVGDGVTDDSTAIQNAINSTADGVGRVYIPGGRYIVGSSIILKDKTVIYGDGQRLSFLKPADGLDDAVMRYSANNLDYQGLHLFDFGITGNSAGQTSSAARGIYLDNSGGTSNNKARNIIENLFIGDTYGDAIYYGSHMRASQVHDIVIYQAGDNGLYLSTASDNAFYNMDIGQSGGNGVEVTGGSGIIHLDNIRSWFSGENGFEVNNSGVMGENLEAQENGENGYYIHDTSGRVVHISGITDGDNRLGGGDNGVDLENVNGCNLYITVLNRASGAGPTVNGINIDRDTYGCNIDVNGINAQTSGKVIGGAGIGSNNIRINGRAVTFVNLMDEFLGDVLADEWNSQKGSDAQAVVAAINSQIRGAVRVVTGDDAAASMVVNGVQLDSGLNWRANAHGLTLEFSFQVSAITDVSFFIGFTDQVSALEIPIQSAASADTITTNATNAVGIMFDTAMDTDKIWLVGVDGDSDATAQNSTVAPTAATYETWRIILSNNGVATFYRNGVKVGSSMNDAVAEDVLLTPVVAAFSLGTASRNIDLDFIRIQQLRNDY